MRPWTQPDHTGALRRRIVPGAGASVLALGLLLLALGLSACESELMEGPGGPRTSTREELRKLLEGGWAALSLPDTTGADSTWAWVKEFYARRKGRPAWGGRSPNRGARRLVEALPRLNEAGHQQRLLRARDPFHHDGPARRAGHLRLAPGRPAPARGTHPAWPAGPRLVAGRRGRRLADPPGTRRGPRPGQALRRAGAELRRLPPPAWGAGPVSRHRRGRRLAGASLRASHHAGRHRPKS